jgi:hypothetical protein
MAERKESLEKGPVRPAKRPTIVSASTRAPWIRSDCAWSTAPLRRRSWSGCVRNWGFQATLRSRRTAGVRTTTRSSTANCHNGPRRIYLFGDEYIFDLDKGTVVETPRLGHTTYVFAKPRSMESFLALYTSMTKEDIRRNRDNMVRPTDFSTP